MQTKITLKHLMSGAKSQKPVLVSGCLALLSVALVLIYSTSQGSRLVGASPTQPLLSASSLAPGSSVALGPSTASFGASALQPQEPKGIFKRSFAGLGCLGVYDKAKFARLDRVCEECYALYREPDIHSSCRQDCFRNTVFTRCVDALLLSHEAKKFEEMVEELYGK